MYCKICQCPLGREDSPNCSECVGCEQHVCERCDNLLSDAITEIDGSFFCAECKDKPLIRDLREFLRSGEHVVQSRDGKEKRWFGVRRCLGSGGSIEGWLVSHNCKVWACPTPLDVEAAIRRMF